MKNIARCKKWRILAGMAILGMLFACADHMLQDAGDQTTKPPKNKNEELTASAAQEWFESNYAPVVATRSAGDQERLFKPHWGEAKEWNRMRYEVVETPIYTQGMHIILDSETETHWEPGKKNNFIRNNVRLVVLRDRKTGKTRSFIMTFVGTYEYLKKTRTIGKNGYLYRQPDFSGAVLFHELNGAFINGWRYADGKIVAAISRPTEKKDSLINSSSVATRAEHQVCHDVCYPVYDSYCDYSYVQSGDMESGIIYDIVENCYPTYSGNECTEECYTYDDGLDDRDDNWNGDYPPGGAGDQSTPVKKLPPSKIIKAKFSEVSKLSPAAVYKKIGGLVYKNYQSNPKDFANACALRLSYAFNMCGDDYKIPFSKGKTGSGDTDSDGVKEWYYYKVNDMVDYLNDTFGSSQKTTIDDIQGKQGIISFSDCNWSDATGHLDIWDGNTCIGEDHEDACSTINFWDFNKQTYYYVP